MSAISILGRLHEIFNIQIPVISRFLGYHDVPRDTQGCDAPRPPSTLRDRTTRAPPATGRTVRAEERTGEGGDSSRSKSPRARGYLRPVRGVLWSRTTGGV